MKTIGEILLRSGWLTFAIVVGFLCQSVVLGNDAINGKFELVDHQGNVVTEKTFDGKLRLVFFGFTQCPVICPTTMIEITQAMDALGEEADRIQPIFITIDPANDTVEMMASYVRHFNSGVIGLTGTYDQVAKAAESFNVTYGGTSKESGMNMDGIYHSSYVYLMDKDGTFLDVFGYGEKADAILTMLENYL